MDQSKWSIPRNRGTRASKSMTPLVKPKCKVQGCWAHGMLLRLYVLDPRVPSDSSTVIEYLISFRRRNIFTLKWVALRTNVLRVECLFVGSIWFCWINLIRTLSRTIEAVNDMLSAKGKLLPSQLLIFETWIPSIIFCSFNCWCYENINLQNMQ